MPSNIVSSCKEDCKNNDYSLFRYDCLIHVCKMLFQITVMVLQTPKGAFKKKIKLEFKPSETLVKSFFQ